MGKIVSISCIQDLKQQTSGVGIAPQTSHFTQGPPPNMMLHGGGQIAPGSQHDSNNSFNMTQPPPNHQMWNQNATSLSTSSNPITSQSSTNGGSQSVPINYTAQIEALNMQQNTLREQIRQSESNLTAQHTVIF